MKTNLLGKKAHNLKRELLGNIVGIAFYGGNAVKGYDRGFSLLILSPEGALLTKDSREILIA